jgi:YidC/Oxa1 family membrane protein insertase
MFTTYIVQPIYNVFIYLIGVMPHGDVGLAIIALTLLIRGIFYPAFAASIRTQMGMQAIQGDIDEINKTYKDDPQEKGKRTMALFKENRIRPFSSFLALFIQLPIFFALYYAFFKEGLPKIATHLLYTFVSVPKVVNMDFFGLINLGAPHNIPLTLVVAALQYCVMWFSVARIKGASKKSSPERDAAQKTQQQLMLYFFPVMMAVLSYSLPAAVGLYFSTTNLVSLGQEWLIRRQMAAKK